VRANHFGGQVFEYTYTPTGRRETVGDGRGTTSYAYDDLDRVVQVTQPDGRQVGYAYDAAGNRTSMATRAGTVGYTYDEANRLSSVTDPWGGVTSYAYDPVGLRVQKTLPNGVGVDYRYDDLNRLTGVTQYKDGVVLDSYDYVLGPAGNRLSVTEADGSAVEWAYDDAYRLTGEVRRNSSGVETYQAAYTYDPAGNRLSATVNGQTTNYTYNALDQLVSAGTAQYEYDGRGNLIRVTDGSAVTEYTWDAADRLTGVALPDGTDVAYGYDADGRRVQQVVDGQVTNYLWDEASPYGDVVLETNGFGAVQAAYVLGGSELIAQRRDEGTSTYLHDGQGSVRALADGDGAITDRYAYTGFGELLAHQGATENAYLYTGQRFDELTGLYQLRARTYDPAQGRFLSRDPYQGNATTPAELNRYVYAANNPVNLTDPTGQSPLAEYVYNIMFQAALGVATGMVGGYVTATFFLVANYLGAWACSAGRGFQIDPGPRGVQGVHGESRAHGRAVRWVGRRSRGDRPGGHGRSRVGGHWLRRVRTHALRHRHRREWAQHLQRRHGHPVHCGDLRGRKARRAGRQDDRRGRRRRTWRAWWRLLW
jgi:RHS repeat-associated protein